MKIKQKHMTGLGEREKKKKKKDLQGICVYIYGTCVVFDFFCYIHKQFMEMLFTQRSL